MSRWRAPSGTVERPAGHPVLLPGPAVMLVRPEALRLARGPAGRSSGDGDRAGGSPGPRRLSRSGPTADATIEVVAPPAAAPAGEGVGLLPSRRAAGGLHLFPRGRRVSRRAGASCRGAAPRSCCSGSCVYPLVLVLARGRARARRAGPSITCGSSSARPTEMAGALGQSLDLGRERGAGGAARRSARLPRSPATTFRAGACSARSGGAARGAAAAGRRDRLSLPLRRDRVRLARWSARAPAGAIRRGGWRAPAPSCWSTPTRCTCTSIFHPRGARVARRLAARGGGEPGRGPLADASRRVVLPLL